MTYRSSDHPRAPKGTPQGGQFTQKAGVGIDDDLEQVTPYSQYSDNELKTMLSQDESNSPQYDDMRTELCQRALQTQPLTQRVAVEELFTTIHTPDGGATYNPLTGKAPRVGFCFSPYPERSQVVELPSDFNEIIDIMQQYHEQNADLFTDDNHYVGFWNNPDDGKVYLDVSVVNYDASKARDACLHHDQIGFFDLQTCQSVTVDKNATSGQGVPDD